MTRTESFRNIGLLVVCEALTRTGAIILLTTMGLAGRLMAPDQSLATLPLALVPATTMLTTIPAAHLMQRWGRRPGFALGSACGILGAVVCAAAIFQHHFYLLCAGAVGLGAVNGFATYYRFAAAEVADEEFRSRAISLVMAGGVAAALLGPSLAVRFKDGFYGLRLTRLTTSGLEALQGSQGLIDGCRDQFVRRSPLEDTLNLRAVVVNCLSR